MIIPAKLVRTAVSTIWRHVEEHNEVWKSKEIIATFWLQGPDRGTHSLGSGSLGHYKPLKPSVPLKMMPEQLVDQELDEDHKPVLPGPQESQFA